MHRYRRIRKIGEGAFGEVVLARDTLVPSATSETAATDEPHRTEQENDESVVAIKHLYVRAPSARERVHDVLREVRILEKLRHPNIITVKEVIWERERSAVHLVMPALACDLSHAVDARARVGKTGSSLPSEGAVRELMRQLLEALVYLHGLSVVHRDLKPGNVMLALEEAGAVSIKLVDFGLARQLPAAIMEQYKKTTAPEVTTSDHPSEADDTEKQGTLLAAPLEGPIDPDAEKELTNQIASRWYRPPEVLMGSVDYDPSVDLWAAGCILAELLELSPLFPGASEIDQLVTIMTAKGTPSDADWPSFKSLPDYGKFLLVDVPTPGLKHGVSPLAHALPNASKLALDLVERLLSYDPSRRPTAQKALKHPWFTTAPEATSMEAKREAMAELEAWYRDTVAFTRKAKPGSRPGAEAAIAGGVTMAHYDHPFVPELPAATTH